jgi:hypothetical protein
MWYSRTILAAIEDAINNLKTKGVSDQVIQFIQSLPNDKKGKAIGALNQNPLMMIDELKKLFESRYKPNHVELSYVDDYDPRFQSWALYQYKLLRSKPVYTVEDNLWEYEQPITGYAGIKHDLDQIHDFFRAFILDNITYNLGSKSFQEAYDDSNEWHRAMTQRGAGKFYLPFKRDKSGQIVDEKIVHRFEDGSMIVRVEDPNDLDVEGAKMHHCIAGYAHSVASGDCTIYSLRNKYNNPGATIEIDNSGSVKQIKGHFNSLIYDDDKVEKIKEFFKHNKSIKKVAGEGTAHQQARDWRPRATLWSSNPNAIESSIHDFSYGPYMSEEISDFSRFGISPNKFDQEAFQNQNIANVDIDDLLEETTKHINRGIRQTYQVDDYNFVDLAKSIVEIAYNKLNLMIDSVYILEEDYYEQNTFNPHGLNGYKYYKNEQANKLLRSNPLLDLLYNFAKSYNEFEESVRNPEDKDFERFEDEKEYEKKALLKMYESEFRLKTEIAKNIYETYLENSIVKKFSKFFGVRFILPDIKEMPENYTTSISRLSFNLAKFRLAEKTNKNVV